MVIQMEMYESKIETITPVHIGSGNVISGKWQESGTPDIVLLDLDEEKISNIDLNNIKEMNVKDLYTKEIGTRKYYPKEYAMILRSEELRKESKTKNFLNIEKFITTINIETGGEVVYIPGSSIKGYIVTALIWNEYRQNRNKLLELINKIKNIENNKQKHKKVSIDIKSLIYKDNFPKILISDFYFRNHELFVSKLSIENIRKNKPLKIKNYVEIVKGESTGSLTIDKNFDLNIHELLNIVNQFTRWSIEKELDLLKKSQYKDKNMFINHMEFLKNEIDNCNNNSTILVLGKFTSILYKTILKLIEETDKKAYEIILKSIRNAKKDFFPSTIKFIRKPGEIEIPGFVKLTINKHSQ